MVLPAPIVPMSEVALIDEAAAGLGQDIAVLMERAGAKLAEEVLARRAGAGAGTVLVTTGPGNNGGDGWVCARHLAAAGLQTAVWPVLEPRSALAQAAAAGARHNVRIVDAPPADTVIVVDALLGAGSLGPPRGAIRDALLVLRALTVTVIAADVPTGIGYEDMLPCDIAVCFQVAKAELLLDERVREFKTVDIGILPEAYTTTHPATMRLFPRLSLNGHKGQHGELLVIGGGVFPGALHLACTSALRTGCDQVRAFTADGPPLPPSIIAHRRMGRHLAPDDPEILTPLIARANAVLIGPGIGREPGCAEAAQQAFSLALEMEVPIVVDADGIAALAATLRQLEPSRVPIIITPHAAEARSLLGQQSSEETLHAFARPDRVVLAKGRVDFVTNGRRWVRNHHGNPRMTVGGTGDCLAGITAGLLARGASPFDAARLAVYWLTTAADRLWARTGPCYLPEEVIAELPTTLRTHLDDLGAWPPVIADD